MLCRACRVTTPSDAHQAPGRAGLCREGMHRVRTEPDTAALPTEPVSTTTGETNSKLNSPLRRKGKTPKGFGLCTVLNVG